MTIWRIATEKVGYDPLVRLVGEFDVVCDDITVQAGPKGLSQLEGSIDEITVPVFANVAHCSELSFRIEDAAVDGLPSACKMHILGDLTI